MTELYRPFTRTGAPIMVMDCASAELCKYAANAMLATRISFMNEIANVCELFGADVDKVRQAVGVRPAHRSGVPVSGRRVRRQLLSEGRQGDRQVRRGQEIQVPDSARPSRTSTSRRSSGCSTRLDKHFGKSLKGKTIAVWGLAFKPRTDDMREAPAIPIIDGLLARGAKVRAYDPEAHDVAQAPLRNAHHYAKHAYEALTGADALLVVTEWNEFREPDFAKMKRLMKQPVIFDGRNIYDPAQIRRLGFTYSSIGRP